MKITICIGSSCHLKGSRQVIDVLKNLVEQNNLSETVQLGGSFCMGDCVHGVNVKVDDEQFSVTPENVQEFFEKEVMTKLG